MTLREVVWSMLFLAGVLLACLTSGLHQAVSVLIAALCGVRLAKIPQASSALHSLTKHLQQFEEAAEEQYIDTDKRFAEVQTDFDQRLLNLEERFLSFQHRVHDDSSPAEHVDVERRLAEIEGDLKDHILGVETRLLLFLKRPREAASAAAPLSRDEVTEIERRLKADVASLERRMLSTLEKRVAESGVSDELTSNDTRLQLLEERLVNEVAVLEQRMSIALRHQAEDNNQATIDEEGVSAKFEQIEQRFADKLQSVAEQCDRLQTQVASLTKQAVDDHVDNGVGMRRLLAPAMLGAMIVLVLLIALPRGGVIDAGFTQQLDDAQEQVAKNTSMANSLVVAMRTVDERMQRVEQRALQAEKQQQDAHNELVALIDGRGGSSREAPLVAACVKDIDQLQGVTTELRGEVRDNQTELESLRQLLEQRVTAVATAPQPTTTTKVVQYVPRFPRPVLPGV